jgi:hypothetical protein
MRPGKVRVAHHHLQGLIAEQLTDPGVTGAKYHSTLAWFNTQAFTLPAAGTYGTFRRNVITTLAKAVPGKAFYISDEEAEKTYMGTVTNTGSVKDLQLFADEGGESVVQDRDGNMYLAAGQILVYSPGGKLIGQIDVPERPVGLTGARSSF